MIVFTEWDKDLVLGQQQIDGHHEQLIHILNKCYASLMLHDNHQELAVVISELRDYTQYHFETERMLMETLDYPKAASHLEAHDKFTGTILEFQERSEAGESLVAMDVLMFLKDWLVAHIKKTDLAFVAFLKEKGAA